MLRWGCGGVRVGVGVVVGVVVVVSLLRIVFVDCQLLLHFPWKFWIGMLSSALQCLLLPLLLPLPLPLPPLRLLPPLLLLPLRTGTPTPAPT